VRLLDGDRPRPTTLVLALAYLAEARDVVRDEDISHAGISQLEEVQLRVGTVPVGQHREDPHEEPLPEARRRLGVRCAWAGRPQSGRLPDIRGTRASVWNSWLTSALGLVKNVTTDGGAHDRETSHDRSHGRPTRRGGLAASERLAHR
jgi:hypothetical protein